jgi:hypothetical protein
MYRLHFAGFTVLCAAVLVLAGCAQSVVPDTKPKPVVALVQNPLYPLKVGNFWRYRRIDYYRNNTFDTLKNDLPPLQVVTDTIIQFRDSAFRCVKFAHSNTRFFHSTPTIVQSFDTFGLVSDTVVQNTLLRLPLNLNDSIHGTVSIPYPSRVNPKVDVYKLHSTCVGTNEMFQTPTGMFFCYVKRTDESQLLNGTLSRSITYSYYASSVGEVGSIVKYTDPNDPKSGEILKYKYVLVEYKVQ